MRHLILLLLTACLPSTTLDDLQSEEGLYDVMLTLDPDPPRVGEIALGLHLRDADGNGVSDCAIEVEAMMPEHGHGGAMQPEVTGAADGHYDLAWSCSMAGHWELAFHFECPTGHDHLVVDVDVD